MYNVFLSWSYTCYCYSYNNICVVMQHEAIIFCPKYYPFISKQLKNVINISFNILSAILRKQLISISFLIRIIQYYKIVDIQSITGKLLSHCEVFSLYQSIIFIFIILPAQVLTLRTFNFWASDEKSFYQNNTCIIKSFFITQSL